MKKKRNKVLFAVLSVVVLLFVAVLPSFALPVEPVEIGGTGSDPSSVTYWVPSSLPTVTRNYFVNCLVGNQTANGSYKIPNTSNSGGTSVNPSDWTLLAYSSVSADRVEQFNLPESYFYKYVEYWTYSGDVGTRSLPTNAEYYCGEYFIALSRLSSVDSGNVRGFYYGDLTLIFNHYYTSLLNSDVEEVDLTFRLDYKTSGYQYIKYIFLGGRGYNYTFYGIELKLGNTYYSFTDYSTLYYMYCKASTTDVSSNYEVSSFLPLTADIGGIGLYTLPYLFYDGFTYDLAKSDSVYYNAGYNDGFVDGSNANTTWYDYVFAVIDAPVNVFAQWFDFNILGVNMTFFIVSLLVICFIVLIVKKVT